MGEKVSISHALTAAAGAEGDVVLYTVPAARVFTNKLTMIFFPIGDYGELEISFYYGNEKVMPKTGVYTGDGNIIDDDTDAKWYSGSEIRLHYKNNNSTETRVAYIYMRGELT